MTVVFHRLSILIVCLFGFYVRAATERYIIYPKDQLSFQERQQFTGKLTELAGDSGNVYTSFRPRLREIRFWCADLTETAYEQLSKDPQVLGIQVDNVAIQPFTDETSDKNSTYLFRRTSEMTPSNLSASKRNLHYSVQYSPVAAELRALSQPVGEYPIKFFRNYVFPDGGNPVYIYHVELGINHQHDDFRGRNIEWLYTERSISARANTQTEAPAARGHSTCTASKAVGSVYGASKKATLVVVKMPDWSESSTFEVLDTVIDDIHSKGRAASSVVSVSWGTEETNESPLRTKLAQRLVNQIRELMHMNVPFVCAAGNAAQLRSVHGGFRLHADTYPASVDPVSFYSNTFFVVGNSDINGVRCPTSQLSSHAFHPQVYAPGVDIKCASSTSSTGYTTWTGTSFSAPLVAGVIADLLSTGQYAPSRKAKFWWQRPGGEYVVWNLVDSAHNRPVFGSLNATLVNYTSPVFATTGFSNEQLDVSSE